METKEMRRKLCRAITNLKIELSRTDYLAIKFFEGFLTAEEYEPIKRQRQAWRDEINALEAELEALKSSSATEVTSNDI